MQLRRVLPEHEKTTLAVDRETHAMVKAFAAQHGMTVVEGTYYLLGRAICEEAGVEWSYEAGLTFPPT